MRFLLLLFAGLSLLTPVFGQRVGINTASPDNSAVLDVQPANPSTEPLGFLPPRLTTAQRDAIASPKPGLMIYNTTTNCMEYWNAAKWVSTCTDAPPCSPPPTPVPTFTSITLCTGQTLNLNCGDLGTGVSYLWNGPNGWTGSGRPPSPITNIQLSQAGTYTVRSWAFGCYSSTASINVTVINSGWAQKTSSPSPVRYFGAAFAIGNKGYIGTGSSSNGCGAAQTDWYKYDASTDTWAAVGASPAGRLFASGFSYGTNGYMMLGVTSSCGSWPNTSYKFNSATDTWSATPIANFPSGGVSEFTQRAVVGSKFLVGFGEWNAASCGTKNMTTYDAATDTWANITAYPGGKRQTDVAMDINGLYYAGIGADYDACCCTNYTDWYSYDPATNAWTARASFTGPSGIQYAYFSLGGYGYVISTDKTVRKYDPVADTWTLLPCSYPGTMTGGNNAFGLTMANGKAYILDGVSRETWEFTP